MTTYNNHTTTQCATPTDCLVLVSNSNGVCTYVLFDPMYKRYVIRGQNLEMGTEFSFNCDSKKSTLQFLKTCFEGTFNSGDTTHALATYTSLPFNCAEITFNSLRNNAFAGHMCALSYVSTNTITFLKSMYNDYDYDHDSIYT